MKINRLFLVSLRSRMNLSEITRDMITFNFDWDQIHPVDEFGRFMMERELLNLVENSCFSKENWKKVIIYVLRNFSHLPDKEIIISFKKFKGQIRDMFEYLNSIRDIGLISEHDFSSEKKELYKRFEYGYYIPDLLKILEAR